MSMYIPESGMLKPNKHLPCLKSIIETLEKGVKYVQN